MMPDLKGLSKFNFFHDHLIETIAIVLLFFFALSIRLVYQANSEVDNPIRADAGRYFSSAYNLHFHKAFSIDAPNPDKSPETRTDLSPGYPVFLSVLISDNDTFEDFVNRALTVQAVMGSLTVVFVFLIARCSMKPGWAILAALFTGLSPHLISVEGNLLSETLFTFVLISGVFVLVVSWKSESKAMAILAGVLLAASGRVRSINLLILPYLSGIFLFKSKDKGFNPPKVVFKFILCCVIGFILVVTAHTVFKQLFSPSEKVEGKSFVSSSEAWNNILMGTYPDYFDRNGNLLRELDPEYGQMLKDKNYAFKVLKDRFIRNPWPYLRWYGGGKLIFFWRWDNLWNQDVYIYPMIKKGFNENVFLHGIHQVMTFLHWPLYGLTLLSPLIFLRSWWKGELSGEDKVLLVSVSVFFYFVMMFTVLQAIPRYSIPLRPFSYIMAMGSLSKIVGMLTGLRDKELIIK